MQKARLPKFESMIDIKEELRPWLATYDDHVAALEAKEGLILEKMAAELMRLDEDATTEWAQRLLDAGRTTLHDGDCTKKAHTCTRCLRGRYLEKAHAVLSFIRGNDSGALDVPHVDK